MTFSIAGRCETTGMLGVAITTSSISVGARCPHARAGVGAVATQNVTDPSLAPELLDRLEAGMAAPEALDNLLRNLENSEYRQLVVVDCHGRTACHTGEKILGIHGESAGAGCYAAGNLLANKRVPEAMTGMFGSLPGVHLGERLMRSLQAGLDAGGEMGEVHSAALLVVDAQPFPLVDLRVDWEDAGAVDRLRALWRAYEPQMLDYLTRAVNPADAPSYGVPGDL
ncbi:MAG: DUF1028 domain-containing protein [Gammaproteobacteria bacterium]|nr:DUF1028 domain-containing protein [Gammaproteobacteria bacterium]MYJ51522.1 DUF1028 domain-containing protein [Gammaproteobacteria bacterium]